MQACATGARSTSGSVRRGSWPSAPRSKPARSKLRRYPLDGDLTIGRAPENDIVLDEPNYQSPRRSAGRPTAVDRGSRLAQRHRLGTDRVRFAALTQGDEIGIGHYRLTFERGAVTVLDRRIGVGLQGVGLVARTTAHDPPADELDDRPRRGAGADRTERLGQVDPAAAARGGLEAGSGEATVDGEPLAVGCLTSARPQQDTIHDRLTVREALACAAALRLPADTSEDEIANHVEAVAAELDLSAWIDNRIESLSGGQRNAPPAGWS